MSARSLHSRIYKREYASGSVRLWADFRDFSDVGGGQEAVKPGDVGNALLWEGDAERRKKLTKRANRWVRDRLEELEEARDRRVRHGIPKAYGLKRFAAFHLEKKAKGDVSSKWLSAVETQMDRATDFFGADRELSSIRPSDVGDWVEELRATSNGRGGTLGDKTIRDHINSLSNLYRRAQSKEAVPQGFNPVRAWLGGRDDSEKPTGGRTKEAEWLEPHEAALYLESARTWAPTKEGAANVGFMYPLIATFLLTGGRKSEVLGLEVSDVDLEDRHVIRFQPNEHRDLKTDTSTRTVPVWPQLREILGAYLESDDSPDEGLLFPSPRREGKMLTNLRTALDAIGKRCGFAEGEVRLHKLRHTYTAARIQTTEHGAPVALFTVARELGHASTRLIERRYGHLLTNRKARGEEVAFRPETYEEELGERLHELHLVA